MPENETLRYNARNANGWRQIGERMDAGQSPTELFQLIRDEFYRTCQRVWRRWNELGIDPAQLFKAALTNPNALNGLIKQISNDSNARLLRDVAAELRDPNMERLIRSFLEAAWEEVEGPHLNLDGREEPKPLELVRQINLMFGRIVRALAKNQSRFPSRPPRREAPPDLDSRLGESLL